MLELNVRDDWTLFLVIATRVVCSLAHTRLALTLTLTLGPPRVRGRQHKPKTLTLKPNS